MPRRNKTQQHIRMQTAAPSEASKNKYPSKQAAEQAVKRAERYNPGIRLDVYKSHIDGAWYLTTRDIGSQR
jgi:hypothetical protein